MKGDVAATAVDGVSLPDGIAPARDLVEQGRPTAFQSVHYFQVAQEKAEEHDQVWRGPVAGGITVGDPKGSSQAGLPEEDGICHADLGPHFLVFLLAEQE